MVVNKKDVEEHHQIIDVLTKKQQELVKETKNNILSERTFQALENLFNVIDVEVKRFNQSNMMKSAMGKCVQYYTGK
jgi:recombinational DNA repair protein (RecF pathway)